MLALLHWKDGKAVGFIPGKNHTKPNILNPLLNLTNTSLKNFAQIFQDLVKAEDRNVMESVEGLRIKLINLWNTVVIPAFLLNVARPDRMPIIDQHTVRAYLALTRGKIIEKPEITWDCWGEYVKFFQTAVIASGYNRTLEERCAVDRALFSWGKSLKRAFGLKLDTKKPKPPKFELYLRVGTPYQLEPPDSLKTGFKFKKAALTMWEQTKLTEGLVKETYYDEPRRDMRYSSK